jgi:hypothetical protein
MQWRNPPSCLDAAYERKAIEDGWHIPNPAFPENVRTETRVVVRESVPDWQREPPPKANLRPHINDLVVRDLESRKAMGMKKYGVPLQPFNGRNAKKDLYEELLDAVLYLRQEMYEQDNK